MSSMWSDELNEYTFKIRTVKDSALLPLIFLHELCVIFFLYYSWSEEGRVHQAWKLKQLSEWNIKSQTHTPPPPPPPKKKTHAPQSCSCLFFSDVFSRCVYMDDSSSSGSDYWPTTFTLAGCIFSLLFKQLPTSPFSNTSFTFVIATICVFFFVSRLLAEVYFRILWSPCNY